MRFFRFLFAIGCLVALGGCGSEAGRARDIEVAGAAAFTEDDARVITARLRDATERKLWEAEPTYSFVATAGGIKVRASAAPVDEDLRYLLSHRGEFVVRPELGASWFEHRHIVDAQAAIDESGQALLRLRLSDEGRERLARFSAKHVPATVQVMFDRRQLTAARVSQPITEGRIEVPVGSRSPKEVLLIAQILRTGALSFQPGAIQVSVSSKGGGGR
ncbi:hypothetical protein OOT46_03575 [Aquabacterium sp. A7-Y]|uniref:SecDF P1 head subdomain-containing protein n=1 Tax=Aquabacterium sp. A7-Y TaxID=1349605 RepID=UPI00223D4BB0|nr:hypothetical protein [Aquabacterium sp. A7-Y]MCW7536932.1 hypothetical protein [Aquabacterium sp. A7-Y]